MLFDQFFLDYVGQMCAEMYKSPVRAVRHVGAFFGMKIGTGLVKAAAEMNKRLEEVVDQMQREEGKPETERSRYLLDNLGRQKEELDQKNVEISTVLTDLFQEIFVNGYRAGIQINQLPFVPFESQATFLSREGV